MFRSRAFLRAFPVRSTPIWSSALASRPILPFQTPDHAPVQFYAAKPDVSRYAQFRSAASIPALEEARRTTDITPPEAFVEFTRQIPLLPIPLKERVELFCKTVSNPAEFESYSLYEVARICYSASHLSKEVLDDFEMGLYKKLADATSVCLPTLHDRISKQMPTASPLIINAIFHALLFLHIDDQPLIELLLTASERNIRSFRPFQASRLLWVLPRIENRPPATKLIDQLAEITIKGIEQVIPNDRLQAYHALGKLKWANKQQALVLENACLDDLQKGRIPEFSDQALLAQALNSFRTPQGLDTLVGLLCSFATVKTLLRRKDFVKLTTAYVRCLSAHLLAHILPIDQDFDAYPIHSSVAIPEEGSLFDLFDQILHRNNVGPSEVALSVWALAKLGRRRPELLTRIAVIAFEQKDIEFRTFEPDKGWLDQEVVRTAWGFAQYRYADEEAVGLSKSGNKRAEALMLKQMQSRIVGLLPNVDLQSKAMLVFALAVYEVEEDVEAVLSSLPYPTADPVLLPYFLYYLAKTRRADLASPLLRSAVQQIDKLSPREVTMCSTSALLLNQVDPSLTPDATAVLVAARDVMLQRQKTSPNHLEDLAIVASGLASLGQPFGPSAELVKLLSANLVKAQELSRFNLGSLDMIAMAFERWSVLASLPVIQKALGRATLRLRAGVGVDGVPHVDIRKFSTALAQCALSRALENTVRPINLLVENEATEAVLAQFLTARELEFSIVEGRLTVS